MDKWWEKYIGREWKEHSYDCGSLVMEVQRNEFNRDIYLPVERGEYSLKEMQQIIKDQLGYFDDQVIETTNSPETGDVALMYWNGRTTHVGVYVINNKVPYILHNIEDIGVTFTKVSKLHRLNCSISAIYRPIINIGIQGKDAVRDKISIQPTSNITDS